MAFFSFAGKERILRHYSDEIAQDLHLFPFSPVHKDFMTGTLSFFILFLLQSVTCFSYFVNVIPSSADDAVRPGAAYWKNHSDAVLHIKQ